MYTRFALFCLVSFPAFSQQTAFVEAVTKAARISGYWEAELDKTQSPIFGFTDTDAVPRLTLNIHVVVRRDAGTVQTSIGDVNLQIVHTLGSTTLFPVRVLFGQTETLTAEDEIEFSGRLNPDDPDEIRLTATPGVDANEMPALVINGVKSTRVVFLRPAMSPNSPFAGDWTTGESSERIPVLHLYVMEPFRAAASLDFISPDSAYLGYPFPEFGSDLAAGRLSFRLDLPTAHSSFEATLHSPDELRIQWRGNALYSGTEFRRLAGAYPLSLIPKK